MTTIINELLQNKDLLYAFGLTSAVILWAVIDHYVVKKLKDIE